MGYRFFIDYNSEIEEIPFSAGYHNHNSRGSPNAFNSSEAWDYQSAVEAQYGAPGAHSQTSGDDHFAKQTYNMVKYHFPYCCYFVNPNYTYRYAKTSAVWVLLNVDEHIQDLDFRILQEGEDIEPDFNTSDDKLINSMEELVGKRVHITSSAGAYLSPDKGGFLDRIS